VNLSIHELAARTGETVEAVRECQQAGLLRTDEPFSPADAERVRLIRFLRSRGFDLDVIARADASGGLLDRFVDHMFPAGRIPERALAEAVEEGGFDAEFVRRFLEAAGLSDLAGASDQQDLDLMRNLSIVRDAGLPEEALLQLARVYADSLLRVAEAEVRLFHFYVHERLRAEGLTASKLREATDTAGNRLIALSEPTVLYFHRLGWRRALLDDLAIHVAQEAGEAEVSDVPAQLRVGVLFADLASFTPLTEAMGDTVAAQVVDRFSTIVRATVNPWHGRVVKQIGDAFMLTFPEPHCAVECALEIETRAADEPHFPAVRLGAHWGEVLYREGDYVGTTVNIASRVAAAAQPHEVLVTSAMREQIEDLKDVEFVAVGKRTLKGVADEIELYRAGPSQVAPRDRLVDPVCGMELGPAEAAARLDVGGATRVFCSAGCLQRFVAAPDRYMS
jgi:class 3 adenylate cyclase/YHS domain-containing protein